MLFLRVGMLLTYGKRLQDPVISGPGWLNELGSWIT